jgi:hypothetical protein
VKNSIEVSSQFDFRGETFRPSATLDLDDLMQRDSETLDIHQLLALENDIDLYSYEYEVLESSELEYGKATGLAASFMASGHFDLQGFRKRWQQQREMSGLQAIAERHLGVDDLESQPGLRDALLEAYRLGKGA